MVCNHSGGMLTPDVPVFAPAFYGRFGYDRPLYTLAHYGIFLVPWGPLLPRLGVVHASPENATAALDSGAVVLVFPGGDYDADPPMSRQNVIDFDGRTGYARTAIETGVPIVPMVSIGAQETQFFLSRGTAMASRARVAANPYGDPAGDHGPSVRADRHVSAEPAAAVEDCDGGSRPVDPATFGTNPDVDEVDDHVRRVMQRALDALAAQRRFPIWMTRHGSADTSPVR